MQRLYDSLVSGTTHTTIAKSMHSATAIQILNILRLRASMANCARFCSSMEE
jgi:hypothetical protein